MANAASTIEIELEIRQAISRLNSLQKEIGQTANQFEKVTRASNNFEKGLAKARRILLLFASALTIRELAKFSDQMTQFENRVKLATNSLSQQIAVQQELFRVAQRTATSISDIGELYSRMRLAAEQLRASQRDLINVTETVGLTLKVQGTSATEASGALQQLGQAFNSPIVQAEEFNSLQDGLPALLKEVTKNLGLQQGQLKKYVNDQKLSNKELFDAILASQKSLQQQANTSSGTIEQSNTKIANSFKNLVGELDDAIGASDFYVFFTSSVSDFIDQLSKVPDKVRGFFGLPTQATGEGSTDLDSIIQGAAPPKTTTYQSAFFNETMKSLEGYLKDIETYGPLLTDEINKILLDVNRLQNELEDGEFADQTLFGSDEKLPFKQYITELNKIVEIVQAAIKAQEEYNFLKIKEAQVTEEQQALNDKVLETAFAIAKAQEKLNQLQKIDIYDGILNALGRFLGIQKDITDETEKQLSNAEKQAKAREQYVNAVGDTVVEGVFDSGPNATRAGEAAQAYGAAGGGIPGLINAAAQAALSNEKVAAAIDSSFELLFEVLDPFLDLLGDLISAINRLIGALIENATNAAEGILDTVGLGPNGYIFGGGLANDLEAAFSSSRPGGPTNQQKAFAQADSIFASIADAPSTRDQLQTTIDDLSGLIPDLGLTEIINRITQNTEEALASLNAVQEINFKTLAAAPAYLMDQIGKEIKKVNDKIAETEDKSKIVIQGLIESYIQEPLNALDNLTQSAQDQIAAIEFQNLSAEEQIQLRYEEAIATIEQQRALADLIDDEQLRTQLLNSVNQATQAQNDLLEKQQKEIQKLNEEREREANLLRLQNVESGLQALLRDFERTIENIADLVQGLFDQVNELLFSDFNLASPQDAFALAQQTYESLLENAFDQDATEDDIKALQAFVNEYLTAARNVFKSSTTYADIFESVLGDLTGLGLQTGFNAPIGASSNLLSDLEEMLSVLDDDFAEVVNELIVNIKAASLAFAQQQVEFITEVTEIPLTLTGDDISISTSGLGGTIELTSENFNLDASNLDLSLAMSTSMFTVDTSRLNFGTITPTATAGIPNLGTITPTVSLNISSVTNSFNQLSAAINSAISNLIASINIPVTATNPLADTGAYAASGTSGRTNYNYSYINKDDAGLNYVGSNRSDRMNFGYEDFAADLAASYSSLGYNLATDRPFGFGFDAGSFRYFMAFKTASEAERSYQDYTRFGYTMGPKVGFRYGGIVDPMDTIPAMLSPGEFILSPETVKRYGVSNLNQLNSGDSAAINATSDPEVKRLLAELIVAVRENDTEVNVYTDMKGQTKAGIQEFRTELRERTRRQGEQYVPARYI
jgi:tape measure domain-containing protein